MIMTSSINYILRRKGVGEKIGPIEEYSETGLIVVRSDQIADTQGLADAKYCFRWGTTATIPNSAHVESVNEPKAIHWAYDKKNSRKALSATDVAPYTHSDFEAYRRAVEECRECVGPVIVGPKHHVRCQDLDWCEPPLRVSRRVKKHQEYSISEYIGKEAEWRIF